MSTKRKSNNPVFFTSTTHPEHDLPHQKRVAAFKKISHNQTCGVCRHKFDIKNNTDACSECNLAICDGCEKTALGFCKHGCGKKLYACCFPSVLDSTVGASCKMCPYCEHCDRDLTETEDMLICTDHGDTVCSKCFLQCDKCEKVCCNAVSMDPGSLGNCECNTRFCASCMENGHCDEICKLCKTKCCAMCGANVCSCVEEQPESCSSSCESGGSSSSSSSSPENFVVWVGSKNWRKHSLIFN